MVITTRAQQIAIVDFIAVARSNGIGNLWACLPANHPIMKPANRPGQIRKVTDAIAEGRDELGNRVRLTPDLRVLQDCHTGD